MDIKEWSVVKAGSVGKMIKGGALGKNLVEPNLICR